MAGPNIEMVINSVGIVTVAVPVGDWVAVTNSVAVDEGVVDSVGAGVCVNEAAMNVTYSET